MRRTLHRALRVAVADDDMVRPTDPLLRIGQGPGHRRHEDPVGSSDRCGRACRQG